MYPRFDQFVRERKYLMNVSPATISWYKHAEKWLPNESPSEQELKAMVIRMREAGLKPTGANAAIRAINAYLRWSESPHKIPQLKEPYTVMPTFSDTQVSSIIKHRPNQPVSQRTHILALILMDTGARISEILALRWSDIDFDNMLLTLHGKGNKDRIVPFSHELRKRLFKFPNNDGYLPKVNGILFPVGRCAVLRSVKIMCRSLGFEPPKRTLHSFRHTFALNYVRRGGSVFHLQKALGHSSLEMSRRYVALSTDDMKASHRSPLTS